MDFSVVILASGPVSGGGMVHAVSVTQPVQSWTVLRSHKDFSVVADALSPILTSLPPCPEPLDYNGDINTIITARNKMQYWLTNVLMYPGARESPEVRHFLTFGANMIPSEFEGVSWVNFMTSQTTAPQAHPSESNPPASSGGYGMVDDMDMDDMFVADDDGQEPEYSDDDEEYSASSRYRPTDEPISHQDEMEIMQLAGEVEMVDDLGSLAQSLGASHLGRSLQLQKEMATRVAPEDPSQSSQVEGVRLGAAVQGKSSGGGLGSAMEQAMERKSKGQLQSPEIEGLGDSFYQKQPVSPPRLDSFKMVKVIGKGSFGTRQLVSALVLLESTRF